MIEDYSQESDITPQDLLYFGIAGIVLFLEIYYMWDWCKLFTNCY